MGYYILGLYGISDFLADTEDHRKYYKEGESIVIAILDRLNNDLFSNLMKKLSLKFKDAQEFRQRHIIWALKDRIL